MEEACKNLWTAVLEKAIKDAQFELAVYKTHVTDIFKESALEWFHSEEKGIGSFLWICTILNIEPTSVLTLFTDNIHELYPWDNSCQTFDSKIYEYGG